MRVSSIARVCVVSVASVWAAGAPVAAPAAAPEVTRVFLARHAERVIRPGVDDPPLTAAGRRRAVMLGRLLRSVDVARVFTTQFLRSRATAESIGVATGAPVETVHSDSSAALARMVRERFHGRTVVIVGHSDSLPNVMAELGWEGAEAIRGWSYDDLVVLEFRGSEPPQILHLHYGGPADTTDMSSAPPPTSR